VKSDEWWVMSFLVCLLRKPLLKGKRSELSETLHSSLLSLH
jgi:hypothetical protein